MSRQLLDTHCHIEDYSDPTGLLDESIRAGVAVIAVTRDPGSYRLLAAKLGPRAGVQVALGLHPLQAQHSSASDLARFFRLLPHTRWVGEVGLDFSAAGAGTRRDQLRVFDGLLAEAQVRSRPMTVHSRGAEKEVVRRLIDAGGRAILHWYTGPLEIAEEALAGGLYFSLNPSMARSSRARTLLQLLPPERVLLETDGPFARHGSRPARPSDLPSLLRQIARRWTMTPEQASRIIVANQERITSPGPTS